MTDRAVEELLRVGGVVPQEWLDAIQSGASSSDASGSSGSSPGNRHREQNDPETSDSLAV